MYQDDFDMPRSTELFRSLNDSGLLTPKKISFILKQAESAGYRWLTDYDPRLTQYCAVFSFCQCLEAQRQMLELISFGTGWVHEFVPANLDINGDGRVNVKDIMTALTKALRTLADSIDALLEFNDPSRRIIPQGLVEELFKNFSEALTYLLAGRRCLSVLSTPTMPRREKCNSFQ